MAASSFTLEWDDFTGGYHVGPSHANQPGNTWRGTGVYVDPNDGMLNGVPDWTTVTLSGFTPTTATGGGNSFLFTDGQNCWRIYKTTTANTANVCLYGYTSFGNAAVGNTAISNVSTIHDAEAWDAQYIFISYTQSSGTDELTRYDTITPGITNYSTPEPLRYLKRWGEFMVGAGVTTPYRLFYSSPYDPTTWDSGDYIDIGDVGPITGLAVFGDTLYVSKPDGWWAVTGVPGQTTTVRGIADGYPGTNGHALGTTWFSNGPLSNLASSPAGILFTSTQLDVTCSVLNGGVVRPVNYSAWDLTSADPTTTGTWLLRPITPGIFMLTTRGYARTASSTRTVGWWLDTTLGSMRWAKLSIPYTAPGGSTYAQGNAARYMPGFPTRGRIYMDVNTALYVADMYPSDDITSGGVTADVRLAPRRRIDPFVVTALYVETVWSASASAAPAVTATVEMRGWTDITSPGRIAPSAVTNSPSVESTTPTVALYHDDRFVYATRRFALSAPAGTEVVPIITFSECKVRRVWAECQPAERS